MLTKNNFYIIFLIICVLIIIICPIVLKNNNNKNTYNIQSYNPVNDKIGRYNTSYNDNDIQSLNKCLYINNLAVNSKYIVDYFNKTKDVWYVNNIITTQILSELLIFSNNKKLAGDEKYTKITGKNSQLNNNTIVKYVESILEFAPDINSIDAVENIVNNQPTELTYSWKDIIKNKLIVQNYGTIFENYTQINYIKNQIYNIIKNGTEAIDKIYTNMFTDYINSNYKAFVIYIDYLHYSSIDGIHGIINIIRPVYNILKKIQSQKKITTLPVHFIIELPRTLDKDEMSEKINKVMFDPSLNENTNPRDNKSATIRSLILGFNIVPGIENNNDISYYNDIWNKYIINSKNNFRFYFDVGTCGQERIIDNDNIIQTLPLNPYSITNSHNIVSSPYILDIINKDNGIISNILENNEDVDINFDNISLNVTPLTDLLIGHPNITKFILTSCNKEKINFASTILPLFDKTILDVYTTPDLLTAFTDKNDIMDSIKTTYKNITGQLLS